MPIFVSQLKKKVQNRYGKMEELANKDRFGAYDSLGVSWDDSYDTLAAGNSHTDQFNIIGYYHLPKGKYRTRFNFNVPKKNNAPVNIIYSNWIYFEVKSNKVEYMY